MSVLFIREEDADAVLEVIELLREFVEAAAGPPALLKRGEEVLRKLDGGGDE